jgi:hypothetical protein
VALISDPRGPHGQAASDPELLLKAVRMQCELSREARAFLQAYNSIWALENFNNDLITLLQKRLASYPELLEAVLEAIWDLVQTHGGVPPKVR